MLIYRVSMCLAKLTVILITDSDTAVSFRYGSCPAFITVKWHSVGWYPRRLYDASPFHEIIERLVLGKSAHSEWACLGRIDELQQTRMRLEVGMRDPF